MKRLLLFVALTVLVSGGCKKSRSDDGGQYSAGGNPSVGGAVQAVRGAVDRTVTMAELHDLHLFMTNAKLANGRVPTAQETWNEISKPGGNKKLTELIQSQAVILVAMPPEEGLWAYTKDVQTKGGLVLTHSGAERVTPEEFRNRFQMN